MKKGGHREVSRPFLIRRPVPDVENLPLVLEPMKELLDVPFGSSSSTP
jgi:hypothetical protein